MYPLLACSVLVLGVVIERFVFWLQIEVRRDRRLVDEVLDLCRVGDWETVRQQVAGCRC